MSTASRSMMLTLLVVSVPAMAWAEGAPGGLGVPGVRLLGHDELAAAMGTGQGQVCNSAWMECGTPLGCYVDGSLCLWICLRSRYKVCIDGGGPSTYCSNSYIDRPCCMKKYCNQKDGQCTDPENYACVQGNCDPFTQCSNTWTGCTGHGEGQCPPN